MSKMMRMRKPKVSHPAYAKQVHEIWKRWQDNGRWWYLGNADAARDLGIRIPRKIKVDLLLRELEEAELWMNREIGEKIGWENVK